MGPDLMRDIEIMAFIGVCCFIDANSVSRPVHKKIDSADTPDEAIRELKRPV
ncbi:MULTISPECIES: hypothetical protein [Pseudomonas syringae group]|uniref:hypothetical protein n=1 Tax=Pseudomonas syringae group TaxID=136849 RepID=UPI001E33357B|nr:MULTISPECIES: hypothetical protein [Pseudomonas]MCD5980946.1 hypothetical protein [Pseudomonas quasicaspiana]MDU8362669.1 hypothetical protein [Pseudomonas syringae group sp. J309-1]